MFFYKQKGTITTITGKTMLLKLDHKNNLKGLLKLEHKPVITKKLA